MKGRLAQWLCSEVSRRRRKRIAQESGWGVAFHRFRDHQVHLGIHLVDGGYLYGRLVDFNPQSEETDDRSLQLVRPVKMRTSPASADELVDGDVVIVGARQIKLISVCYADPENGEDSAREQTMPMVRAVKWIARRISGSSETSAA